MRKLGYSGHVASQSAHYNVLSNLKNSSLTFFRLKNELKDFTDNNLALLRQKLDFANLEELYLNSANHISQTAWVEFFDKCDIAANMKIFEAQECELNE